MARFRSVNLKDVYIKVTFNDHSIMVVIPSEKLVYYADKPLGKARGITDETIGKSKLEYKENIFSLDNKNDYQYCLHVYLGVPGEDVEGECRFSDYVSEDKSEVLSLGWQMDNGKRADVLVKEIDLKDIVFK